MKSNVVKQIFKGSLRREFLLISIVSVIIMACGITASVGVLYNKSMGKMINTFNQAYVDINRFVNRNDESCEEYLNNVCKLKNVKAAVYEYDSGKILMKSKNVTLDKIDVEMIHKIFKGKHADGNIYQHYDIRLDGKEYDMLIWDKEYSEEELGKKSIIIIIICSLLAVLNIYIFAVRKARYIKTLAKGIDEFSKGNLDYNIVKKGRDELSYLSEGMNLMAKNLKASMEAERIQEKFKTELITNVSHDLRTPLTSLIGYLELINDEKTSEDNRKKYTNIAIEKAYKLKTLIGDLFDYSKLECGGISLEKSKINIIEIIEQSIGELYIDSKEKNMVFKKEYLNGNIELYVDSNKIGRVFENLLSNAVKYGVRESNIYINVIEEDEFVTISVENEVEGQDVSNLENLFERFYRGDSSRNSNISGSGLGLAIAKSIINLHNGYISLEGKDNLFKVYVKLPKTK